MHVRTKLIVVALLLTTGLMLLQAPTSVLADKPTGVKPVADLVDWKSQPQKGQPVFMTDPNSASTDMEFLGYQPNAMGVVDIQPYGDGWLVQTSPPMTDHEGRVQVVIVRNTNLDPGEGWPDWQWSR